MTEPKELRSKQFGIQFDIRQGLIRKTTLFHAGNFTFSCILDRPNKGIEKLIHFWIEEYLRRREPKVALPLDFSSLSHFTKRILQAIRSIPFGSVASYKDIGERVGHPNAARVIGNICHRNRFSLVIPCHRIIKSDGTLGGFSCGLDLKRKILEFERYTQTTSRIGITYRN
jgi:O-6-methylguanine DNA methyltransferase